MMLFRLPSLVMLGCLLLTTIITVIPTLPEGLYPKDAVQSGEEGVEIKATNGGGAVDTHGARAAWLCVFRYAVDTETEPAVEREPTQIVEILLARLCFDDFRRNPRSELGTRTASSNRSGIAKLRSNWSYRAWARATDGTCGMASVTNDQFGDIGDCLQTLH